MTDELYDFIEGLMNQADEAVQDLSLQDAFDFMCELRQGINTRVEGLRSDLRRG